VLIEQAIFTSTQTSRAAGYQLVAVSPGICDEDARELSAWGPSHDSLWERGPAAVSVNFHPLPSGAYCISQTTPAGGEYSQRRGPQIYTGCLVVRAEHLAPFANCPFALLRAAVGEGVMRVHEKIPKRLEAFSLDSTLPAVDRELLARLAEDPGPEWCAGLVQAALESASVGIVAGENGPRLLAGLIHCLPVGLRLRFSFSTGLRFSLRRPFQLICLPDARNENQRLARQHQLTLLDRRNLPGNPLQGWARYVQDVLESGDIDRFYDELSALPPDLPQQALNELGVRLHQRARTGRPSVPPGTADASKASMDQIDDTSRSAIPSTPVAGVEGQTSHPQDCDAGRQGSEPGLPVWPPDPVSPCRVDVWRADGSHLAAAAGPVVAHTYNRESTSAAVIEIEEEPARLLTEDCPAARTELQRLEDVIFEALAGKPSALAELRALWPHVLSLVGRRSGLRAREHFLRYALSVWRQFTSGDDIGDPERAASAMEVVCLLFDE
jgi:hypothetical protein